MFLKIPVVSVKITSTIGLFSIVRFNITFTTHTKFVEPQKSGRVKAGVNVFSYFSA